MRRLVPEGKGRYRVMPWLRQLVVGLSPRRPGFTPGSIHVGIVVDKVTLGQVVLQVLRLSPVNIIPRGCPYTCITSTMNNSPVGGRSSEIYFHPIDMNKNKEGTEYHFFYIFSSTRTEYRIQA
jgi:hypothetical protein